MFGDLTETTRKYQGISVGALVLNGDTLETVDQLYLEIKFDAEKYSWTTSAERIHGLSVDYLNANGIEREEAAIILAEFILKHFDNLDDVIFGGHHVDFDIAFTNQLLRDFDLSEVVPHHIRYDTSVVGAVVFGIPSSKKLFEFFGFERGTHNAFEDAEIAANVIRVFRGIGNEYIG